MEIKKSNPYLEEAIRLSLKKKIGFWKRVAEMLNRPRTRKVEVNLSKLSRFAEDNAILVVPGKVLGSGTVKKPIKVAAFSYSKRAKKLISESGGSALSLSDAMAKSPKSLRLII